MTLLRVHAAGPAVTVQDRGRPGWLARGLSCGGAADPLALAEGAALLGQGAECAALEMAGSGGRFETDRDVVVALTGAPMRAVLAGARLAWNATHLLPAGVPLEIGGAEAGVYGYLHLSGGVATAPVLGSRSAHLAAGIGAPVGGRIAAGAVLPLGPAGPARPGLGLAVADRFSGGVVRIVASAQTALFAPGERARFEATAFTRDARANRQGVRLAHGGAPFRAEGQLSALSEVVVPGDVQMTGEGVPFVLLAECQTMGGYPRIGTVVPDDLPLVAQAAPGAPLRFRFVGREEALADHRRAHAAGLVARVRPLVRDPAAMADLLSHQLVGGVTAGDDLGQED